jgi:cytoskeletal protein RodZ
MDSGGQMPGKHHQTSFAWMSRHRYPLIVGVVLLCIAVAGVLAAVSNRRQPEPPLLIVPAQTVLPSPVLIPPSVVPSPSPSRSASPSRTASSRRPSARPSPRASFTAQYVIVNGRRSTFQVSVTVKNTGSAARGWKLVVTHDPADGVRAFGSGVTTSGDTITLSGDPLQPGKSVTVGFWAAHRSSDDVRPTSCKIDGRACTVTTRRYRNDSPPRTR